MKTPTQAAVLLAMLDLGLAIQGGGYQCSGSRRASNVTNEWREERNKKRKAAKKAKLRNRASRAGKG